MRNKYPQLQSSLVQCARDMASGMLKREKFRYHKPVKKHLSGIRYNQRKFTPFLDTGKISISTVKGRKKFSPEIPTYFQSYVNEGRITSLTLGYNKKRKKIVAFEKRKFKEQK